MIDNSLLPVNEICFTTTDGKIIKGSIAAPKKFNTNKKGKGVMAFKEPVVQITEKALYRCTGLQEVIIPSSVTAIGDSAFGECDNMYF